MRRSPSSEFDFVAEVAADFPIRVLAKMLDVPDADIYKLIDWGNRMVGNTDPEHADVLAHSDESEKYRLLPFRSPAALEVFEYGRALADERRGTDRTDLVSRLVNQTPEDGIAAVGARLQQLLPAARRRRQRDHPAHDHATRCAT